MDWHGDDAGVAVVQQRRGMVSGLSEAERCEKGYGGAVEGVGEGEALAGGSYSPQARVLRGVAGVRAA